MAARTAAYGKAAYGWAVKRGALTVNPFTNLPVAPTIRRNRVLAMMSSPLYGGRRKEAERLTTSFVS